MLRAIAVDTGATLALNSMASRAQGPTPQRETDMSALKELSKLGFVEWHTGGGCMALALPFTDGSYILVTDGGGTDIPSTDETTCMVSQYDTDGQSADPNETPRDFFNVVDALEYINNGLEMVDGGLVKPTTHLGVPSFVKTA